MPAKLTEDMVIARTKTSDLGSVRQFNCWGSELADISVIRRFGHVEVLSLSLNNISTLADFQYCQNLVELYVRRNDIRDLSEICYLQELPRLRRLLLAENPCVDTAGNLYRATVLRALPNLEILDSVPVTPEEIEISMKSGLLLEHPLADKHCSPEPCYERESSPPQSGPPLRCNSFAPSDDDTLEYTRSSNVAPFQQQLEMYYQQDNPNPAEGKQSVPAPRELTPPPTQCRESFQAFPSHNNNNNCLTKNANNPIVRRDSGISPNSSDSQHSGSPPSNSAINFDGVQRQRVSPENGCRNSDQQQRVVMEGSRNGRRQSDYALEYVQQYCEPDIPRRLHSNHSARSESSRSRQRTKLKPPFSGPLSHTRVRLGKFRSRGARRS